MTFCALCTSDRGPFARQPLGKNDAPVNVCARCDGEVPRAYDSERGYEAPLLTDGFRKAVNDAHRRIAGKRDYVDQRRLVIAASMQQGTRTANMRLVRVPHIDENGRSRDVAEARAALADRLHPEARFLGSTRTHHIFEQPDPDLVRKWREPERDVLGDLARLGGSK